MEEPLGIRKAAGILWQGSRTGNARLPGRLAGFIGSSRLIR